MLLPAAAFTAVLAEPITRLIYEHGEFGPVVTDLVSEALLWFSFSLPFSGVNLLLTRAFFSLQRPWIPTALAIATLVVNAGVALALYEPYGIAGLVVSTAVASAAMTVLQAIYLRRELHGRLEGRQTAIARSPWSRRRRARAGRLRHVGGPRRPARGRPGRADHHRRGRGGVGVAASAVLGWGCRRLGRSSAWCARA